MSPITIPCSHLASRRQAVCLSPSDADLVRMSVQLQQLDRLSASACSLCEEDADSDTASETSDHDDSDASTGSLARRATSVQRVNVCVSRSMSVTRPMRAAVVLPRQPVLA